MLFTCVPLVCLQFPSCIWECAALGASKWTWSKVVRRLALCAGVPTLTTHSFRHLCLTDLARTGWDIEEIASFAGHRSIQSTLLYIHLSAQDLADKFARSMAAVHEERLHQLRGSAS